jgi:hypothetical protein
VNATELDMAVNRPDFHHGVSPDWMRTLQHGFG